MQYGPAFGPSFAALHAAAFAAVSGASQGGGGGGTITPTGQFQFAANNFKIGTSTIASTGTLNECAGRSKHPIAGRYSKLKVAYHAWYMSASATSENLNPSWDIKKAALELGGVTAPIKFSGGRTKTIDSSQAFYLSDEILPADLGLTEFNTTNCANLWHRIEATAAVGGTNHWTSMIPGFVSGSFSSKYAQANSLNQVDATGAMSSPTGATANGIVVISPLFICGVSLDGGQISVLGHGDSISVGAGTGFVASDGGTGLICEALWNGGVNPIPGVLIGKISAQASEYATSNAFRKAMMAYANVCLDQFGTNDIQVSSANAATLFASNKLIWEDSRAAGIQRVVQTKLMPDTETGHVITALTSTGTTATCTIDDTSWMTGQAISVVSVNTSGYNISDTTAYTVINGTQFTYTVASGLTSPATFPLGRVGDQFRSKAGTVPKSAWVSGGVRDQVHTLYAAALTDGTLDAFPDTLTPVADATDDHWWVSNGTANYATADGVHPNALQSAAASAVLYSTLAGLKVDQNIAAPKNLRTAYVSSVVAQEGVAITIDSYDLWKDVFGLTPTYQWKRDGANISGATSAGYTPVTADVGTTLTRDKTYTSTFGSATMTTTVSGYVWPADGLTRFVADNFDDTASLDLASHTPALGGGWAKNGANGGIIRSSGPKAARAYGVGTGCLNYSTTTSPSNDQTAYGVLDNLSAVASEEVGLALRADTTVGTYYAATYQRSSASWRIIKSVAGTVTQLGIFAQALTIGQLYSMKFSAIGTSLALSIDGVQRITATDSAVTTGRVGIRHSGVVIGAATGNALTEIAAAA